MSGGSFYAKGGGGKGAGGGKAAANDVPLPGALKRKLEAMRYPEMGSAGLASPAFQKIVLWLEEEKIRFYEKHDRRALRDFNKAWWEYAEAYCKELGVPAEGLEEKNSGVKLRALNGLTNLAINDIYRDKVEAGELTLVAPPKAIAAAQEKPPQKLEECISPLNRLLECFALPVLQADATDNDTLAAMQCIHARVCPPAAKDIGTPLNLDELPVGLQIDDPEVKRAACVLRLLHGNELRQLQVHINQVINELQQLTADPKVDARLGRVGR